MENSKCQMFEVGDIVKIKPEWRNPGEEARDRYIVTEVDERLYRCRIKEINSSLVLPCVETVGFEMIEMIASHRFVYTVCFHHRDGQPVEEYEYHNKDDAEQHFELFREDTSGLYSHIDLTETRIGLPEVVLCSINFEEGEKTMRYPFTVRYVKNGSDRFWVAKSLVLEGCVGQGSTPNAAVKELEQNEQAWLDTAKATGIEAPELEAVELDDDEVQAQ